MNSLRVALLQTNPHMGAIDTNAQNILDAALTAAAAGAQLGITPQMALTGYPLEDVALRSSFQERTAQELAQLAAALESKAPGFTLLVGTLAQPVAGVLANSAAVLRGGVVEAFYHKKHLPAEGALGDARNFTAGQHDLVIDVSGVAVQVLIGSDTPELGGAAASTPPQLVAILDAEPFHPGVLEHRKARAELVQRAQLPGALQAAESSAAGSMGSIPAVALCNAVGGQDDLVFDGGSILVGSEGNLHQAPQFEEQVVIADLDVAARSWAPTSPPAPELSSIGQLYAAITLGLRDYAVKTGFSKIVLGLSGGIDSALVAAIAADAIGGSQVIGISMPSAISSEHSKDDAADSARRIGLDYRIQPIASMVDAFQDQLNLQGVAYENLQARVRGVILMAVSNTEGALVLATGNRSESAMGYSTIYGDAVGGYAPIKDVPKTLVWELSWYRNELATSRGEIPPIPENSITKPPSAELSPGQQDDQSLPPYEELDQVLERYIADNASRSELLADGFTEKTVDQVLRLVDRAEWKRRQYPLGPKVSAVALGRDRRLPIMNSYRDTHEE